jgi:23S rRNA pseudouridine955/2504/2580 synthase
VTEKAAEGATARYHEIDEELAGQRLDNFLLANLKGVPRSHVYRLVRSGQVRVNSRRVGPGYRIKAGDRVRIPPVRQAQRGTAVTSGTGFGWLRERIVFEDDRVLLIDKPAGLAVHGGSGVDIGLIEALRASLPAERALELVHRLDRETSGCLLVAKRRSALRTLHGLVRDRGMHKYYLALVAGSWPASLHRVDRALARQQRGAQARVRIDDAGKESLTWFEPVARFGNFATLLGATLETGRTHQIRVHAAAAGHPLGGDPRYGSQRFNKELANRGLERMFLHAASLSFVWPDDGAVFGVCVPLPQELRRVLGKLRAMA